ncbi:MAG TPA: replicative DNA helicase, partial [Longimicrobiaceae bacterium]|nr:replicative DNA helicase [Longimicrobiaceae bacterium]
MQSIPAISTSTPGPGPQADRRPPYSLEAEMSVLGGMLIDADAVVKAVEIIDETMFFREAHRRLFRAMVRMWEQGSVIEPVTLSEQLKNSDDFDSVGGAAYLAQLWDYVPTAANLEYHAKIVREKALLRRLIEVSTTIIQDTYENQGDVDRLLDEAESRIFQIAQSHERKGFVWIKELLWPAMEQIEILSQSGSAITGVPSGFGDLDALTAGFQKGDLVIVAARPSMGKTAFTLNVAQHAAISAQRPVAFFSLEMSKESLVQRMLTSEARVDASRVRTGRLRDDDYPRLAQAAGLLNTAPIYIDDTPGISILEMRAKARRLKSDREDLSLIVVDYLQLMTTGSKTENRQQEVSEISRGLKALAKELDVPVVALSQLSRAVESRPDKRPMMSDLRECVAGDTLVSLTDGRRIPIRDLVGTTPEVWALSPEGKVVAAHSDCVWKVGSKPIFEVRFASGRTLRATARHRVLTADGWDRVETIEPGDRIALARRIPEPAAPDEWTDGRIVLLGQLIGDGSYLRNRPLRYTTSSEENSRAVAAAARTEFDSTVTRHAGRGTWHQLLISGNGNRWHHRGVGLWLRELGIWDQRSHEKRVPAAAFRLSNRKIALLLRHLWATDGTISPRTRGRGSHAVYYATNSRGLAEDVAALLLRLGFVARISTVGQGQYRPAYHVHISGGADQLRFVEIVGAFGPRRSQAAHLRALIGPGSSNTNVDTVPREAFRRVRARMTELGISTREMAALRGTAYGGAAHFQFAPSRAVFAQYADLLDDDELRREAASDLFW